MIPSFMRENNLMGDPKHSRLIWRGIQGPDVMGLGAVEVFKKLASFPPQDGSPDNRGGYVELSQHSDLDVIVSDDVSNSDMLLAGIAQQLPQYRKPGTAFVMANRDAIDAADIRDLLISAYSSRTAGFQYVAAMSVADSLTWSGPIGQAKPELVDMFRLEARS